MKAYLTKNALICGIIKGPGGPQGSDSQNRVFVVFILENRSYKLVLPLSKILILARVMACQSWLSDVSFKLLLMKFIFLVTVAFCVQVI